MGGRLSTDQLSRDAKTNKHAKNNDKPSSK